LANTSNTDVVEAQLKAELYPNPTSKVRNGNSFGYTTDRYFQSGRNYATENVVFIWRI
jgi:hypothetical protein